MTPQQYKATLDALGLDHAEQISRHLGVDPRTHFRYATKGPREPTAKLLTLLLDIKTNDDPEYYQQALKIIGG